MAAIMTMPWVQIIEESEDPRVARTRLHPLPTIILLAILGVLCGADTWADIELFGQRKRRWRATLLDLPHGLPSHDPFGRVFAVREAEQFEAGFLCWVQTVVSAFAQANRLVLGPTAVDHKSHEITAIPVLWQQLMLTGCMVTLDREPYGWGCQKDIAQALRDQDADYVLGLKANPPTLHDAVAEMFAYEQADDLAQCPHTYPQTVNKGHGWIETRQC